MMAETGCSEFKTPAFVHKLLLASGAWDEAAIRPKAETL